MKNILVLVVSVLLFSFAIDETIKKDFISIGRKMNEAKSYRTKIRVIYDYAKSDQVHNSYSKKLNNSFAYSFNGNTVLINEKYLVAVHDESKLICVQNVEEPEEINDEEFYLIPDSLFDKNFKYSLDRKVGEYKVVKTYITDEQSAYSEIRIMYHATKHYLKEIEHICSSEIQKNTGLIRIRIIYDEFNFSPGLSQKDFSEKEFIEIKSKNKIVPSDKYKNYRIIDQRLER